jgi:aminoglycoside 2'-N-acetyltransferase I
MDDGSPPTLRLLTSDELSPDEVALVRALLGDAFGTDEDERFTDDDWDHALGGLHHLLEVAGSIVAHASVVERELRVDDLPIRTGYVEAVAVAPSQQRKGYGSRLMHAVNDQIGARFALGALGTGRHAFYERLGWRTWRGPTFVRTADGLQRTPDEDGYVLVLPTPSSPHLDIQAPISCDWRRGDVW